MGLASSGDVWDIQLPAKPAAEVCRVRRSLSSAKLRLQSRVHLSHLPASQCDHTHLLLLLLHPLQENEVGRRRQPFITMDKDCNQLNYSYTQEEIRTSKQEI